MTLLTHTHRFNKEKIDTVSARILETNTKYNLKNQICTFSDPDFHDILFMKTGGTSLHFGSIYSIEKSKRAKKEIWTITTNKGTFKFQILRKPTWHLVKEVKTTKDKVVNFESRTFIKRFLEHFNIDTLYKNIVKSGALTPARIERPVNTYNH